MSCPRYNVGDRLFFIDRITDTINECVVLRIFFDAFSREVVYTVHDEVFPSELNQPEHNLFPTEEDAKTAKYSDDHKKLLDRKAEINSLDDLVRFPLNHPICGEQFDPIDRLAYKLRAEELGFNVFDR